MFCCSFYISQPCISSGLAFRCAQFECDRTCLNRYVKMSMLSQREDDLTIGSTFHCKANEMSRCHLYYSALPFCPRFSTSIALIYYFCPFKKSELPGNNKWIALRLHVRRYIY